MEQAIAELTARLTQKAEADEYRRFYSTICCGGIMEGRYGITRKADHDVVLLLVLCNI